MSSELKRFANADAAAKACARHILRKLDEALAASRTATLALSGGSTPKLLFPLLAQADLDWSSVHLFWVDERVVPPGDPLSNYRLAATEFVEPARFPKKNVHRIQAELGPQKAARLYEREIKDFFSVEEGDLPRFDLIHLGMGPDAHTASLFPGDPLIANRENFVAPVHNQEVVPPDRITLLPGVLLAARNTVFLVAGEDKAEAVDRVFEGPDDPSRFPAQLITRMGRRVTWFIEDAAARLLPEGLAAESEGEKGAGRGGIAQPSSVTGSG
jgi:6-phosphogluconolactonase